MPNVPTIGLEQADGGHSEKEAACVRCRGCLPSALGFDVERIYEGQNELRDL